MQRPSLYMSTGETKQRVMGGKKVQQILQTNCKNRFVVIAFQNGPIPKPSCDCFLICRWHGEGLVRFRQYTCSELGKTCGFKYAFG